MNKLSGLYLSCILLISACSPRGPLALFNKLSPHEQYAEKLKSAGLDKTAMGKAWLNTANSIYTGSPEIKIPYKETGYFSAERTDAVALRFKATKGQKLNVEITTRPKSSFLLFADISMLNDDGKRKEIISADSAAKSFSFEIKKSGTYFIRLQPELLKGGEYSLSITSGPSLEFPVAISGKPAIGSFWGDSRDAGGRRHEGIDIFAPRLTPALAARNGSVSRVTENNLGGRVVFMRPDDADYTLYYAHLDEQLVRDGQVVHAGDTIGLVGNTGNAKNTPSHLHFGIYTSDGPVDPFPFVDRKQEIPDEPQLPLARLNDTMRIRRSVLGLNADQPVRIIAVQAKQYRVMDINSNLHWVPSTALMTLSPIRSRRLDAQTSLYDHPDTSAARKLHGFNNDQVQVVGSLKGFDLVRIGKVTGWVVADR